MLTVSYYCQQHEWYERKSSVQQSSFKSAVWMCVCTLSILVTETRKEKLLLMISLFETKKEKWKDGEVNRVVNITTLSLKNLKTGESDGL